MILEPNKSNIVPKILSKEELAANSLHNEENSPLSNKPPEIIELFFLYLHKPTDKVALASTCKRIYSVYLMDNSEHWRQFPGLSRPLRTSMERVLILAFQHYCKRLQAEFSGILSIFKHRDSNISLIPVKSARENYITFYQFCKQALTDAHEGLQTYADIESIAVGGSYGPNRHLSVPDYKSSPTTMGEAILNDMVTTFANQPIEKMTFDLVRSEHEVFTSEAGYIAGYFNSSIDANKVLKALYKAFVNDHKRYMLTLITDIQEKKYNHPLINIFKNGLYIELKESLESLHNRLNDLRGPSGFNGRIHEIYMKLKEAKSEYENTQLELKEAESEYENAQLEYQNAWQELLEYQNAWQELKNASHKAPLSDLANNHTKLQLAYHAIYWKKHESERKVHELVETIARRTASFDQLKAELDQIAVFDCYGHIIGGDIFVTNRILTVEENLNRAARSQAVEIAKLYEEIINLAEA